MAGLKKDHVWATGAVALAGGVAGATAGVLAAGPLGAAVGTVAGVALGAQWGDQVAEAADPRGDLGHFEQIYQSMPYHVPGMTWDDYRPAYQYGIETHRLGHATWDLPLTDDEWVAVREHSRLSAPDARAAMEHVWRAYDRLEASSSTQAA